MQAFALMGIFALSLYVLGTILTAIVAFPDFLDS
jgi:hypothetical protein